MTHQVTLNPINATFRADGHETVLEASLRHDLLVPYGCRTGGCGACRAKITSGTVDHGKASETTLTPADREAGFALLCCAVPQTDVVVEVKDVRRATDIPVKTLPSRIEGLEKPATDVAVLTLRLPATEMFQFHAGQYVDILLKDGKRRSFSIANPPHDAATIELHVRHVPGGLFTDQVFSTMKVRDILRFNGPHGSFYLRESEKPMILLAGGTGFAPIKSIVLETLHLELQRPIHIYWGARDRAGLYQYEVAED
ncbi:MAG: 2Fe-2S iron-sulfur cluster-binding protein, partial [Fluviibacter sp.]